MTGMTLMQRSFYGSVLILVILGVRFLLLGRLPKRTFPVLWTIALLRLLLPLSLSFGLSIYSLLPAERPESPAYGAQDTAESLVQMQVQEADQVQEPDAAPQRHMTAGQDEMPERKMTSVSENFFLLLSLLRYTGTALCALWFTTAYLRNVRLFRKAVPVRDLWIRQWLDCRKPGRSIRVRMSDRISAPLAYGCVRPVILLPERLLDENCRELEYVLQHEYVHIRRLDAARKLAMAAALCIHWFNPLVWLMSGLLTRDIELACDEGVLQQYGEQSRAEYAMALIGMEEKKRSLPSLCNGFGKNAIEERITLIMKYKRPKYVTYVSSILLALGIALLFATSAEGTNGRKNPAGAPQNEAAADPENTSGGSSENGAAANLENTPVGSSKSEAAGNPENTTADPSASSMPPETDAPTGTAPGAKPVLPADGEESPESGKAAYTLSYMSEGIPVEETADLYRGSGYSILIPARGWQSYAPDAWSRKTNAQIQVWITDYSGSTRDQVVRLLEEQNYRQTETEGLLEKESEDMLFYADIREEGFRVMCVNYSYPSEPELIEGTGTEVRAIASSFTAVPDEGEADLTGDGKQVRQLALAFWESYLAGDAEALAGYLTADYKWEIEIFPDGRDGHIASEARVLAVKGTDRDSIGEAVGTGETRTVWIEFSPAAGADYLEYLTIEAIKGPEGWKIQSYGLEM